LTDSDTYNTRVTNEAEVHASDDAHRLDIDWRYSGEIQTIAEIVESRKIDRFRHGGSDRCERGKFSDGFVDLIPVPSRRLIDSGARRFPGAGSIDKNTNTFLTC